MHHPPLRGRCPRRALFTWKLDPVVARRRVPAPLKPKLLRGSAFGAVDCLRLEQFRPRMMPPQMGLSMEMCTHVIAVHWMEGEVRRDGLYVLRRDVQVRGLGRAAGLLLPGHPNPARIQVQDEAEGLHLALKSQDGTCELDLAARLSPQWMPSELFEDAEHLLRLLGNRSGGFLACDEAGHGSLVQLDAQPERAEPLLVQRASSTLFGGGLFPEGSAQADAAVLLRELVCVWTSQGQVLNAEQWAAKAAGQTGSEPEGRREPFPA